MKPIPQHRVHLEPAHVYKKNSIPVELGNKIFGVNSDHEIGSIIALYYDCHAVAVWRSYPFKDISSFYLAWTETAILEIQAMIEEHRGRYSDHRVVMAYNDGFAFSDEEWHNITENYRNRKRWWQIGRRQPEPIVFEFSYFGEFNGRTESGLIKAESRYNALRSLLASGIDVRRISRKV